MEVSVRLVLFLCGALFGLGVIPREKLVSVFFSLFSLVGTMYPRWVCCPRQRWLLLAIYRMVLFSPKHSHNVLFVLPVEDA